MSNHNVAKAYANYTRQPILTDGVTFAQMLLTKSYAPETFESYMRSNVRYYVPRFSFESAMREMPLPLRNRIDDALFKLTHKNYDFYNPSNDLDIADEDLASRGRPLCKAKTISSLSGYIMCSDADPDIACTDYELAQIVSYMNGGFYYE